MDLIELSEKYLKHCRTMGRSNTTLKTYRSVFRRTWDLTQALGIELDSRALDHEWAEVLVEVWQEQQDLKPATLQRNVGALSGLFKFARKRRFMDQDPLLHLELPQIGQVERVRLSMEQLNALEEAAALLPRKAHRVMAQSLFLLQCAIGTRRAELIALRPDDFDLHSKVVRIRRGKGGKYREVPMGERAFTALREWLQVRAAWLETREGDDRIRGEEPDALWLADRGRGLSFEGLSCLYDELARLAGLNASIRTHDLRHMTAQSWRRGGVPLETIQLWLGHSDLRTTKLYIRDAAPDTRQWAHFCDLPQVDQRATIGKEACPVVQPGAPKPDARIVVPPVAPVHSGGLDLGTILQALQLLQAQQVQQVQQAMQSTPILPADTPTGSPTLPVHHLALQQLYSLLTGAGAMGSVTPVG